MSGNVGASNTRTPPVYFFSCSSDPNSATSDTTSTLSTSTSTLKPSYPSGTGTSSFGVSRNISGTTPVGTLGTSGPASRRPAANTGSAFGASSGGSSVFGQPKPATVVDSTPEGTSMPAYSGTRVDVSDIFLAISAAPAYRRASSEELRVKDYQQNRKMADASGQTPSETPKFGAPIAKGSVSGGGTSAFGTTARRPATGSFGAFGQQQPTTANGAGEGTHTGGATFGKPQQPQPTAGARIGSGSIFSQPAGRTFDPKKLECVEELLRRSLLGEELINTQFHLFSAKSSSLGRVVKPRVLCVNNALLAKNSKYFLDLLSSDINPSDSSLSDLTGDNDIPSNAQIDEYGYESDSDLDDCDDPTVVNSEAPKDRSASLTPTSEVAGETKPENGDALSEDASESVGSDVFVITPKQSKAYESFSKNKDEASPAMSSKTVVQETVDNRSLGDQTALRLRSLESRHILVKDTAFQTWYTLLNYLYTSKFSFLPLSSTIRGRQCRCSSDVPRCSAKSMYRLASKIGLDHLRDEAFAYIQRNLSERNILKELSCRVVSKHPQLLEMELDVLYTHIASPPIVANFAILARRIALNELPHGGDIIVGIYTRLLKEHHPLMLGLLSPAFLSSPSGPSGSAKPSTNVGNETKDKTGPLQVNKQATSLPSEVNESIPSVPPQVTTEAKLPTATTTEELEAGGPKNMMEKRKASSQLSRRDDESN